MSIFNKSNPKRAALIRGRILTLLYYAAMGDALNPDDPYAMSKGTLVAALEQLRELPAENDLHSALRYLEEKEYLEVAWLRDGQGSFESIRLRTEGIDLVEGNAAVDDRGVMITARR